MDNGKKQQDVAVIRTSLQQEPVSRRRIKSLQKNFSRLFSLDSFGSIEKKLFKPSFVNQVNCISRALLQLAKNVATVFMRPLCLGPIQ